MKKIIYYDNWDKGYRNFLRLDSLFKQKGYSTLLLHTSSLKDSNVEIQREIGGMQFRDISYYKTLRLKKIIKKENPSAIIMLNLSFMIDRAIVSICKELEINLYHLSHGMLIPSDSIDTVKNTIKESGGNNLLSKLNRKNWFSLFNYFVELKSFSKSILFFQKAIKNHTQYTLFPKYTDELEVEKSFVYYPSDYNVMINDFDFPEDSVQVVGNPELDFFYNSKIINKEEYCRKELDLNSENYIAYFDDGLGDTHGWDLKKWMLFLKDLNEVVLEKQYRLIVKLHPRRDIRDCISFFEENKIKYILDVDFKKLYLSFIICSKPFLICFSIRFFVK